MSVCCVWPLSTATNATPIAAMTVDVDGILFNKWLYRFNSKRTETNKSSNISRSSNSCGRDSHYITGAQAPRTTIECLWLCDWTRKRWICLNAFVKHDGFRYYIQVFCGAYWIQSIVKRDVPDIRNRSRTCVACPANMCTNTRAWMMIRIITSMCGLAGHRPLSFYNNISFEVVLMVLTALPWNGILLR